MAQQPARRKRSTALANNPDRLRKQLERIDRELVKLIALRTKAALHLAKLDPSVVPAQVSGDIELRIAALVEQNHGPLPATVLRGILRDLFTGTAALEQKPRVAFLGPQHSYSHQATVERFGAAIEEAPMATISAVFEEVYRGHVKYGVVPLENSTDGRIADTLDMFTRLPVKVCGEISLRIHHNLLGKCPRHEIAEVYSRPQALSQCRNWLAKYLPNVRIIEVTSTSTAAQLAKEKHGAAAIASAQAGRHYGLDVIVPNIEDNQENVTRFVVIAHESAPRTGQDRTALMFEVEHRPGGLADAINVFKKHNLNLTWIESFPIAHPGGGYGYMFFVELDGHEQDKRLERALALLVRRCQRLEVLGSFPRCPVID